MTPAAHAGPPLLGVYVHWPYCARICPYCDFNVVRDRGRGAEQAALAEAIIADLTGQRALTGARELVSVYFGGGTPSLMDPDWVARILAAARSLWTPAAEVEVTLEANPTDAESGRFEAFAQAGVARLSLDMIYARPGQTPDAWAEELKAAIDLGASHISPYQLTIESGTAFERAVRRGRLVPPAEEAGAALYDTTQETLGRHGFEAYEVSNHAQGLAARSRHNLVYWRGEDYVGVGPGAHGRLTLAGARTATRAAAGVTDYIRRVAETGLGWEAREVLTPREAAEERVLMGLRTVEGVELAELEPLGLRAGHSKLADLAGAGLLSLEDGRLVATASGRLVLDRLTAELALAEAEGVR